MAAPFVVVGGDAAGLSAASKCKREDPDREVIVFERGQWVSFAHCGTPYYVKGTVDRLTDLLSLTPAEIADRGIDLRREHEVVAVSTDDGHVTVRSGGETTRQPYGDLLVATGARAATATVEGVGLTGAFTLHGMDDAAAMRAYLLPRGSYEPRHDGDGYVDADRAGGYADMEPPATAAVVGGGYVGIEVAEALSANGVDVTLFQRGGHVLPAFGGQIAERVEDHLRERGIDLRLHASVDRIEGTGRVESVVHGDDRTDVEMVVVGVGIRPNVEVLEGSGVELGDSGAIAVDTYGRTGAENVYAAGDCAEARHAVTGKPAWVPLGLTANRAGRAVGATVAGDPMPVGDTAGTALVKAFDLGAGRTGIVDPRRAREAGFDPASVTITASSRSGYYPGAAETTVTLVADRVSRRVLGGSTVGRDRAAKLIDPVAAGLAAGMTVEELQRLDLGYAPPFSPVWDPVLVAAKVLAGELAG